MQRFFDLWLLFRRSGDKKEAGRQAGTSRQGRRKGKGPRGRCG